MASGNPQEGVVNECELQVPPKWRLQLADALRLRHHEDLRSCGIVGFTYFLYVVRWRLRWAPLPWVVQVTSWLTLAVFSFFCATIVHNCIHVPQFRGRWLNNAWQIVLTLSYGFPVSVFIPGHNLSHHKHTQGAKDVIRTSKMRWETNFLNLLLFIPTVMPSIQVQDTMYMMEQRKKKRPVYYQTCREMTTFVLVQLCIAACDWWAYWLWVMTPQLLGKFMIITINLIQHDGCPEETEDRYNHSRNFTGPVLNFLTCNNGYHTIHHLYPGMHWSVLKTEHDRLILPHIHPNLLQPNILWYVFSTYFLTGGRKMYDGSPYIPQPYIEDEPWFTMIDYEETYTDERTNCIATVPEKNSKAE